MRYFKSIIAAFICVIVLGIWVFTSTQNDPQPASSQAGRTPQSTSSAATLTQSTPKSPSAPSPPQTPQAQPTGTKNEGIRPPAPLDTSTVQYVPLKNLKMPKFPEVRPPQRPVNGKADPRSLDGFRKAFKDQPVQIDLSTIARLVPRWKELNPSSPDPGKEALISENSILPKETPLMVFMDSECYAKIKKVEQDFMEMPEAKTDIDLPIRAYAISLRGDTPVKKLLESVHEKNCVIGYGQNGKTRSGKTTADPMHTAQRHHSGILRTYEAYNFFYDATKGIRSNVYIAVLDTGIQLDHPDLAPNLWSVGYNFVHNNNDTWDRNGHGTNVAGLLAARSDNGNGGHGVIGQYGYIMPVKVLNDDGFGTWDMIVNGINWAVSLGANVLNISIWGDAAGLRDLHYPPLYEALRNAGDNGRFVALIAGNAANDANNYIPGRYGTSIYGVVTVGSIDSQVRTLSPFSNYSNALVEIAAPGSGQVCGAAWNGLGRGEMLCYEGTSMSAPIVAGAAALAIGTANSYGGSYHGHHAEWIFRNAMPTEQHLGGGVINGKYLDLMVLAQFIVQDVPASRPPVPTITLTSQRLENHFTRISYNSTGDAGTVTASQIRNGGNVVIKENFPFVDVAPGKYAHGNGFHVTVANPFYGEAHSGWAAVDIPYPPQVLNVNASIEVYRGQQFDLNYPIDANPAPTYQWYHNGQAVSGATSHRLLLTAEPHHTGTFTLRATNAVGNRDTSTRVDVIFAPSFTAQPESNKVVPTGKSLTLQAAATGHPAPTYQWYKNDQAIPGATHAAYSVTSATASHAGVYKVVATNRVAAVASNNATISVMPPPTITQQPTGNLTLKVGKTLILKAAATGENLSYQWTFNAANIAGATSNELRITSIAKTNSGNYALKVTNPAGTVTSSSVAVQVQEAPRITTQPLAQIEIPKGAALALSVTAVGTPSPTFQWFKDNTAISGAAQGSYNVASADLPHSGQYHVVISNAAGTVTSTKSTVSVYPAPVITNQPATSITSKAGENIQLSVTATGKNIGYQWMKNGAAISGANATTLQLSALTPAQDGTYMVVVSNPAGKVNSTNARIIVQYAPSITKQPVDVNTTVGSVAVVTVEASGNPVPTYQWYKLSMGERIPIQGANQPSLNFPSVMTSDRTEYEVELTNSIGKVISEKIELKLPASPRGMSIPPIPYLTQESITIDSTGGFDIMRAPANIEGGLQ